LINILEQINSKNVDTLVKKFLGETINDIKRKITDNKKKKTCKK